MRARAQLATLALVVAMFAAAEHARCPGIVFPEIAALALGAWVMTRPPWPATTLTLWLSPTLAAVTGVLLVRHLPGPLPLQIGAAFLLVMAELRLVRSAVLPSLSAAMLPIVTRTATWSYALSVCALTAVVALGRASMGAPRGGQAWPARADTPGRTGAGAAHWIKLLGGVLLVSAMAWTSRWTFIMAPPLGVAFVELSNPDSPLRARARPIFFLLVAAAFTGVLWVLALRLLHGPMWVAAGLSLGSMLLCFHASRLPFPPAAAIALLPAIVPAQHLWAYPLHVSIGGATFWLVQAVGFADPRARLAAGASRAARAEVDGRSHAEPIDNS